MKAKKEAHTKSAFPSQGRLQNRRVIVRDSLIRYPPKKEKAAVRALSDNTRNGDSKSPRNPSRLKIRRSQPSSLLRCLARARSADNTVVDQCYPRRRGAHFPIFFAIAVTKNIRPLFRLENFMGNTLMRKTKNAPKREVLGTAKCYIPSQKSLSSENLLKNAEKCVIILFGRRLSDCIGVLISLLCRAIVLQLR